MGGRLSRFLSACSMDWRMAQRVWSLNRAWADVFTAPMGMVDAGDSAASHRDIHTAA